MRRTSTLIVVAILLGIILPYVAHGAAEVVVREVITITVDRARVRTDVPPIVVNGHTLVPVRGIFRAFNAEIGWFPVEKRVFIRDDSKVIWLQIGEARAQVNDDIVPLNTPAMIYRGRTMVPLRFIAETLGATVDWNPTTQQITIVTRRAGTVNRESAPSDDRSAPADAK